MKKICIFSAFIILTHFCAAQDIIKLKSGLDIEVSIIEINPDEIKYRMDGDTAENVIRKEAVNEIILTNGTIIHVSPGYIGPNMNYKQYRKLFNPADYVPWEFDSYNPGVSGTLSFFIPGLGQFTDYEYGRAAAFFFGSLALAISGPILIASGVGYNNNTLTTIGIICMAGDLSLRVANTIDAVRVAKIKNMYEQRIHTLKSNGRISINPIMFQSQTLDRFGIGLAFAFVF